MCIGADGNYDENGKQLTEHEFCLRDVDENDKSIPVLISEEDFDRRIELFFEIYKSWGFKKPIKSFVVPNGVSGMSYETVEETCRRLYKHGIIYWSDSFTFPETVRVINGVACFKWGKTLSCDGGEISLYEEKREFNTFKVTYSGTRVTILTK